jgi:endoglycosylceramidase
MDEESFLVRQSDLRRLQCPGFLSEFGALSNTSSAVEEINVMTGLADSFMQSWTYWQFKSYNDITTQAFYHNYAVESLYDQDGQPEWNKIRALSRTYAQATAGHVVAMSFDPDTAYFTLVYTVRADVKRDDTVIFASDVLQYPRGSTVTVLPAGCCSVSRPSANTIVVSHGKTPVGTSIRVTVERKQ